MCDIWLSRHQSSTVQRYRIYRLTEYIRHMFTTESPRGNLLAINSYLWSTHTCSFLCLRVIPHSCRGLLDFKKGVNEKWRVVTFMKSCDFYEMLRLWWKVVTFMKSCNFYEKLWLLWKVVTFMKGDDLSERLWLFQRFVTFPVRHNKNIFALPFIFYK